MPIVAATPSLKGQSPSSSSSCPDPCPDPLPDALVSCEQSLRRACTTSVDSHPGSFVMLQYTATASQHACDNPSSASSHTELSQGLVVLYNTAIVLLNGQSSPSIPLLLPLPQPLPLLLLPHPPSSSSSHTLNMSSTCCFTRASEHASIRPSGVGCCCCDSKCDVIIAVEQLSHCVSL